jgi:hypothetical protein
MSHAAFANLPVLAALHSVEAPSREPSRASECCLIFQDYMVVELPEVFIQTIQTNGVLQSVGYSYPCHFS